MRALVKERPGKGLVLKEVPPPRPGDNEVLIRVKRVGLCGTDAHIYAWNSWAAGRLKPPVIIGHEFAGTVEEIGQRVTRYWRPELPPGQFFTEYGVGPWEVADILQFSDRPGWVRVYVVLVEDTPAPWEDETGTDD